MLSGKFDNNSTESEIATVNCEYNVLKRDFETKRNGCETHDGCVNCFHIKMSRQVVESRVENMQTLKWALDVENVLTEEQLQNCSHNLGNCSESVPWKTMRGNPQPPRNV